MRKLLSIRKILPHLFLLIFIFSTSFIFVRRTLSATNLVINEFLAHPASGQNEWVEIYNPGEFTVDLKGWTLIDRSGSEKSLNSLPSISKDGFTVYEYPGGDGWLNNTASEKKPESITLKDNTGKVVDSYTYKINQKENVTTGRSPDGSSNWVVLSSATKGEPNSSPVPTDTPTFVPTQEPTSTPKPTPTTSVLKKTTPKLSKSSPIPTQSPADEQSSDIPSTQKLAGESGRAFMVAENMPTSVLGESTQAAMTTSSAKKDAKSEGPKVLGSKENNIAKILIGIGIVFILICAILVFRQFKKDSLSTDEST